jgi:hypothetical protein
MSTDISEENAASAELKSEPNKNPVGSMKMKATCFCKMLVDFICYNPKDQVIAANFVVGLRVVIFNPLWHDFLFRKKTVVRGGYV